jgi:hypothetical protein
MKCRSCGADSIVRDSRSQPGDREAVWRRRGCLKCKARWTTYERDERDIRNDVTVDLALNLLADLEAVLIEYADDPAVMTLLRRTRKLRKRGTNAS